jgi:hypothetical protein
VSILYKLIYFLYLLWLSIAKYLPFPTKNPLGPIPHPNSIYPFTLMLFIVPFYVFIILMPYYNEDQEMINGYSKYLKEYMV